MLRQRILLLTISISFTRPLTAAMTEAVADVNAEHLRALEDALNVMFAHPIFESIQSMPPAPIRAVMLRATKLDHKFLVLFQAWVSLGSENPIP